MPWNGLITVVLLGGVLLTGVAGCGAPPTPTTGPDAPKPPDVPPQGP